MHQPPLIPQTVTRTYPNEKAYHRDAARLTGAGFTVAGHGPGRKRGETVVTWGRMVPVGKPHAVPPQAGNINVIPLVVIGIVVTLLGLLRAPSSATATATATLAPPVILANADPTVRAAATGNAAAFATQTAEARPTATPAPTAIPRATSTPPPTADTRPAKDQYPLADIRIVHKNPESFRGVKLRVRGEVFSITEEKGKTGVQMWVSSPYDDADRYAVAVFFTGTTSALKGSRLTAYGVGAGTISGTNAFGGNVSTPLLIADIIVSGYV